MTQLYSGPEYGTAEYYSNLFGDIIVDAQHDSPETADNIVEGFRLALAEWKEYHQKQVDECEKVESKFNETFND